MSAILSSTRHALRSAPVLRQLQAEVAAMRPDEDPEVIADIRINAFIAAAHDLLLVSPERTKAELHDLKLAVNLVERKLFRVEFVG